MNEDGVERPWRAGERAVREGRWWDAHEHWETCWRALPLRSQKALAVQALIQYAAALHKVEQPVPRHAEHLEAGMGRLIARAERNWTSLGPAFDLWASALATAARAKHEAWVAGGERPARHPGLCLPPVPASELSHVWSPSAPTPSRRMARRRR